MDTATSTGHRSALARLGANGPVILAVALLALFFKLYVAWIPTATGPEAAKVLGHDYLSFYTAGRLGLSAEPALTYDRPTHERLQKEIAAGISGPGAQQGYVWFGYPPTYLTVVMPFSTMPYLVAFHVFMAATAALFGLAIWTIGRSWRMVLYAFAYPAAMVTFIFGQNAFLTAGLIALALALLPRRAFLAGVLIGLLCLKPQLGLVFPVILAASGRWRAFSGAAVAVAASVVLTLVLFGPETWQAWLAYSETAKVALLEQTVVGYGKMQSLFAVARYFGAGVGAAYLLQGVVALTVAALVGRLWRSPAAYEVKAAAAIVATLLMTPFCLVYDLLVVAPALAFLVVAGRRDGFATGEPWLIGAVATTPVIAALSLQAPSFVAGPIGLAVLFGWCVWKGRGAAHAAVSSALGTAPALTTG